jgi:hypothetical protein
VGVTDESLFFKIHTPGRMGASGKSAGFSELR